MSTNIKCPNCGFHFEPSDAIREEVEKTLRSKMLDWQKQKEKQFQEEKNKLSTSLESELKKTIFQDFENKLKLLEKSNKESEDKLRVAREKELEFMKKELDLKNR